MSSASSCSNNSKQQHTQTIQAQVQDQTDDSDSILARPAGCWCARPDTCSCHHSSTSSVQLLLPTSTRPQPLDCNKLAPARDLPAGCSDTLHTTECPEQPCWYAASQAALLPLLCVYRRRSNAYAQLCALLLSMLLWLVLVLLLLVHVPPYMGAHRVSVPSQLPVIRAPRKPEQPLPLLVLCCA